MSTLDRAALEDAPLFMSPKRKRSAADYHPHTAKTAHTAHTTHSHCASDFTDTATISFATASSLSRSAAAMESRLSFEEDASLSLCAASFASDATESDAPFFSPHNVHHNSLSHTHPHNATTQSTTHIVLLDKERERPVFRPAALFPATVEAQHKKKLVFTGATLTPPPPALHAPLSLFSSSSSLSLPSTAVRPLPRAGAGGRRRFPGDSSENAALLCDESESDETDNARLLSSTGCEDTPFLRYGNGHGNGYIPNNGSILNGSICGDEREEEDNKEDEDAVDEHIERLLSESDSSFDRSQNKTKKHTKMRLSTRTPTLGTPAVVAAPLFGERERERESETDVSLSLSLGSPSALFLSPSQRETDKERGRATQRWLRESASHFSRSCDLYTTRSHNNNNREREGVSVCASPSPLKPRRRVSLSSSSSSQRALTTTSSVDIVTATPQNVLFPLSPEIETHRVEREIEREMDIESPHRERDRERERQSVDLGTPLTERGSPAVLLYEDDEVDNGVLLYEEEEEGESEEARRGGVLYAAQREREKERERERERGLSLSLSLSLSSAVSTYSNTSSEGERDSERPLPKMCRREREMRSSSQSLSHNALSHDALSQGSAAIARLLSLSRSGSAHSISTERETESVREKERERERPLPDPAAFDAAVTTKLNTSLERERDRESGAHNNKSLSLSQSSVCLSLSSPVLVCPATPQPPPRERDREGEEEEEDEDAFLHILGSGVGESSLHPLGSGSFSSRSGSGKNAFFHLFRERESLVAAPRPRLHRQSSLDENKLLLSQCDENNENGSEKHHHKKGEISFSRDFVVEGVLGTGTFAEVYRVRSVSAASAACPQHLFYPQYPLHHPQHPLHHQPPVVKGVLREGVEGPTPSLSLSTPSSSPQRFAVKKMKRQFRSRKDREWLLNEVLVMKRVTQQPCPYIIPFVRAWQEDNHFYVQLGLAERGTLRDLVHSCVMRNELVSTRTLWHVVHDVCAGLQHIHECGVVHLDIKPANLLISREGKLLIGDFGMASDIGSRDDSHEGDTRYMAPELLNISERLPSADIFSLALTLYELCYTQESLSRGALLLPTEGPLWHKLREGDADPVRDRPAELVSLIQSMLRPDPAARPTAREICALPTVCAVEGDVDDALANAQCVSCSPAHSNNNNVHHGGLGGNRMSGTGGVTAFFPIMRMPSISEAEHAAYMQELMARAITPH